MQMAAIHMAMMSFAKLVMFWSRPSRSRTGRGAPSTSSPAPSPTQMEALKRYRTGGEQKVTVQHVTVNDGGQAMVGTVNTGGGAKKMSGNPIRPADTAPERPAMRCQGEEHGAAVPRPGGEGLAGMSPARRPWRLLRGALRIRTTGTVSGAARRWRTGLPLLTCFGWPKPSPRRFEGSEAGAGACQGLGPATW